MKIKVSQENSSFDEIDIDEQWNKISNSEKLGEKFVNICKDLWKIELMSFDIMWISIFFHDFKKSRAKHGTLKACGILLLLCILRGIGKVLIWKESFWSGFLYPFQLALFTSTIILLLFSLHKKFPKITEAIIAIILGPSILILAGIFLLILYGIIMAIIT